MRVFKNLNFFITDELKKFEKRKNKSQQPKNCILIETSDNISDIFSTIDQI